MSALPAEADIDRRLCHIRFVNRDRSTAADWLIYPMRLHFEFLIGSDYQEQIVIPFRELPLLSFRRLCRVAVPAILIAATASANAQQYPTRAIRVISPYPAGSASDTVTRVVMDQVSQLIGQPVVIEMRPGAGGSIGFSTVAKSDPDGYTLVTSSSSMATESVLHKTLPYDPVRDFVPVILIGTSPNLLVASAQSGFKTVADLVAPPKRSRAP